MKKITYILLLLCVTMAGHAFAQGEVEAWQFSRNGLHGTARSMSMGGAFGALGGDMSSISINPAGIAVYRTSEAAATFSLNNETSKVGNISKSVMAFDADNLGFVNYFPLRNNTFSLINFGFTFNRLKSFEKDFDASGTGRSTSLTDYIVNRFSDVDPQTLDYEGSSSPFLRSDGGPWLPILAYQGFLIHPLSGGGYESILNAGDLVGNSLSIREYGSIDSYDFTMGTTVGNKLNMGMSINVTSIYYRMSSRYTEDFPTGGGDGFDIYNSISTSGAGFGVKLGAIFRPVHSLRLGLAYHSPTWYNMSDIFGAQIDYKIDGYTNKLTADELKAYNELDKTRSSGTARWDYAFTTPYKWVASAAGVFGNNFILSLDYEYTDYKAAKFSGDNDEYSDTNGIIRVDSKPASTIRIGTEYRFTPQLSGRLGYAWVQNPYSESFKNEWGDAMTSGSIMHYRMEGDTNYLTAGLGYRFSRNFFMDLALVFKTQQDDLYPFANLTATNDRNDILINAAPYTLDNSSFRGVLTLGYKF